MSHAVRLHMCQVYVCTAHDMVLCVGQASLRVSCCVVLWLGRCGGLTRKVSSLPQPNYLTQWRSREDGRGGGGLEKRRSCVQPCGATRASLVRARAARALSEAAESRRAVAHVPSVRVLHRIWCCAWGKRLFVCPVVLFCGWGAAEVSHGRSAASQPEGVDLTQSPHQPLGPTSWAPVQRESRTIRPISLAFLGVQQTVVRQSTRATSVDRAASAASSRKRVSTHY